MRRESDAPMAGFMEQWIAHGSEDTASVFAGLFERAIRIERERFLGAAHRPEFNKVSLALSTREEYNEKLAQRSETV